MVESEREVQRLDARALDRARNASEFHRLVEAQGAFPTRCMLLFACMDRTLGVPAPAPAHAVPAAA